MAILPHHIAAGLLVGGITIGGYFAFSGLIPPELDAHLTSLGVEVLKDGWASKETEYLKAPVDELITSINKESNKQNIDNFGDRLKKWCDKYKQKPFLGEDDSNYKRFSRWCTKTEKIQVVLQKRGLKALTEQEKATKFEFYNSEANTDKFLNQRPSPPKTPAKEATAQDLDQWCIKTQTEKEYKYESDPELKKVFKWCYNS